MVSLIGWQAGIDYNFNNNTMPIQISPDAFKWMQGLSIVKDAKRNQSGLMEVSEEAISRLVDGPAVGMLLRSMLKGKNDEERLKKLDSLKEHSTPAIRLYNWGILADVLKQIGYSLEPAEKSKFTNLDPEPLARLIPFLCEYRSKDPTAKPEAQALRVDIAQIGKKGVKDATNALQFLTILISKHFKISPQQTLNLFLDNNKYLSHLLAKGVKNSFDPIHALLTQLKTYSEFVVQRLFCLDEAQNVAFLMNALRTCLIGKDEIASLAFCDFLQEIYHQYRLCGLSVTVIHNWMRDEGVNTLFFGLKKQPLLSSSILQLCYDYLGDDFFPLIQPSDKSILWSTDRERLGFYKQFVEDAGQQALDKFAGGSYFEEWNRLLLRTMKKGKEQGQQGLIVGIMQMQWGRLGSRFEQHDLSLATHFLNFLTSLLPTRSELLFLRTAAALFALMHTLGQAKNPFAPLIYKTLVTAYSSITSDSHRLIFLSDNFTLSFKGISGLPGNALVQPILKHLEKNPEPSVITLGLTLIEEKRIGEDESMDLIEMFTKIAFQDIRLGGLAMETIFQGLQHVGEQLERGYLENNIKLCLSQLYSSAKAITKTIKTLKDELPRLSDQESAPKAAENFTFIAAKHIICKSQIGFISRTIQRNPQLKVESESPIFLTYLKIKVEIKKLEQAELLKPIMTSYYEDEQLQEKISFYMNKLYPPKIQPQKSHGHNHDHDHSNNVSKSLSVKPTTPQQEKSTVVILDPSLLKPSSFAMKDLEKARLKRYQLKTIQQQKEKQRQLKAEKMEKFRTIQNEKRLIESMATIKNDVEYNHIQTLDTRDLTQTIDLGEKDKGEKGDKEANVGWVKLVNLEKEEEETYKEEAEAVMRKFRKVWRYLFYKYSGRKGEGGQEKAHMGQVWRLLKDYEFTFLKKDECFTIVRLINESLRRKNDIQFLTYSGFQEFILQSAIIGYSRQGQSHIPPGQQLLLLVQQLKKVTRQKSGSVQIFDNPEQAYFQQTEVIREFNRRLRENADYILPEGYKRVKQTSLEYEYDFHPMLQKNLSPAYVTVMEVLDLIVATHPALGFHLIEPLTIKSELFLAKPVLFQNLSLKMKDYTKGYLNPKRSVSTNPNEPLPLPSPPRKEFKPYVNFSLGVKLGIAETSLKDKSIAEEVAYCMEDMLNAIETGSPIRAGRRRVINEVMRRKRTEASRVQGERRRDETNWKKRAQSVKLQVQALREKRKQGQRVKKKKEYLQRKAKKEKEEKSYKQKLSEFERVKAKIAEKRESLLQLKEVEQERLKKEKEGYRRGVEEYFKRKKDELREVQEQFKRKKNEEKEKKEAAESKSKQFAKKLYVSNLKREEEVLGKIDEIKEGYEDAFKSEEVQGVLSERRASVRLLFQLLLKYQKSKISATNYDQIGVATLNYFCLKFKIVPFMLQKQDVGRIYTYALKETEGKRKGIDSQKFQQILFLISVKAKRTLNRIVAQRKKKQKRMQSFLNAQKSGGGNHFQVEDLQESSQEQQIEEEEKPTLQDEYLFNAEGVTQDTLQQVFTFLRLPGDKAGMEERYKQAMQTKTSKPKSLLIKEIKQTLDQS